MFRTFAATSLLTLACAMPVQQAAAQDAIGGAIFGGAAGALLGGAIGGRGGAIAGGIIGGTTGAAIAAEGQRRARGLLLVSQRLLHAAPGRRLRGRRAAVLRRPRLWSASRGLRPAARLRPGYGPPRSGPGYGPAPAAAVDEDDEVEMIAPGARAVSADAARRLRAQVPLLRSAQRHVPVARRHAQALPVTASVARIPRGRTRTRRRPRLKRAAAASWRSDLTDAAKQ